MAVAARCGACGGGRGYGGRPMEQETLPTSGEERRMRKKKGRMHH